MQMDVTRLFIFIVITLSFGLPTQVNAQDATATPSSADTPVEAPAQVDVQPIARDDEIQTRLEDILLATGWFMTPDVRVQDGVVFLSGETQTQEFKTWAGDLARNTQDVAAVVNQITVIEPSLLDFQPIWTSLRDQTQSLLRSIPIIGFSLVVLLIASYIARLATRFSRDYLQQRDLNVLLRNVIARTVGLLVILVGLYLVFQIAGWTNIALTILGGTGLLGLILGIAFRDITENFLASIFLSVQNPFNVGDLVEIDGIQGFVQRMTTRTTILMTLAGNHVQIPNATVYKSIIHNYTSNPNLRIDFIVGIGYEDSITLAQETIRTVLENHPAILDDPEELVLVDELGSATVNLHIYFWIDGSEHSALKMKSSVIRLVKRAIEDAGISMPDEAREMIFPKGVPVEMLTTEGETAPGVFTDKPAPPAETEAVSTRAEGDLRSEASEIQQQAEHSRTPEEGENLLSADPSTET